jgi:hypothetical protein
VERDLVAHVLLALDGEAELGVSEGEKLVGPLEEVVDLEGGAAQDALLLRGHGAEEGATVHAGGVDGVGRDEVAVGRIRTVIGSLRLLHFGLLFPSGVLCPPYHDRHCGMIC